MSKVNKKKIVINLFVILTMTLLLGILARYGAGLFIMKSLRLDLPLTFNTASEIANYLTPTNNKKVKLIVGVSYFIQIFAIAFIPVMFSIVYLAKKFKKRSRFGDAKWATDTQLKDFGDIGAYKES